MKSAYCADCIYDMFGSDQVPCKYCIDGDLKSKVQKLKSCSTCVHDGTGDSACLTCYDYEDMGPMTAYRNYEEKKVIDPELKCKGCLYDGNQLLSTQCSVCLASGHHIYYRTEANTKGETKMNNRLCMNCVYFDENATGPHCTGCVYDLNHPHYISRYVRPKDVKIKKMILNPPATILIFDDDTKTVVKCMAGDIYDPEKGVALAMLKKLIGPREYRQLLKDSHETYKDIVEKEIEDAIQKLRDNGVTFH